MHAAREADRRGGVSSVAPAWPAVFEGFLKLLAFWGEVYCSHACERRFLEFSSGIPFAHWQRAVDDLNVDLRRIIDAPEP